MATSYTTLLGLALPATGELSGTWGDTVNNYISNYIDAAVAGAQTVTTNTTLTKTTGSSLGATSSQYAIIIASPASANITITAPAASKIYTIINTSGTYTVTIRGAGPTTGVTLGVNEKAQVAWNGSDFVKIGTPLSTPYTANGVVYASSTSALTTGSALVFDGNANLSTGGANPATYNTLNINNTSSTGYSRVLFNIGSAGANGIGGIKYAPGIFFAIGTDSDSSSTPMTFNLNGSEQMRLTSTGLGIGTSSPGAKLQVNTGAVGTVGQIVQMVASQTADVLRVTRSDTNLSLQFTPTGQLSIGDFAAPASTVITTGPSTSTNANLKVTAANAGNSNLFLQSSQGGGGGLGGPTSFIYFGDFNRALSYIGGTKTNASASNASSDLVFGTTSDISTVAVTERMRLDSSGNLGIGTSSPTDKLTVSGGSNGAARVNGTDNVFLKLSGAAANEKHIDFYHDNTLAFENFLTGTNNFVWRTRVGGVTEYMRLNASGALLVGATAITSNANYFAYDPGNAFSDFGHATGVASGVSYIRFLYAGTVIGSITQNGTTGVLYNITSDQRLKENIQDAESASNLIDAIQVRQYDWKSDGSHQRYGFVAQELVTVAPEAVHQPADPEEMMAVDYSKLVPMLVKEIQSLRIRIAQLENKL